MIMKKFKRLPVLCICALVLILVGCVFGLNSNNTANASGYATTTSYISRYDITYDINDNRKLSVTEDLTMKYNGNAGFYKYIPTNGGELVKNLSVTVLSESGEGSVYHRVRNYDDGLLEIEIDDDTPKRYARTYRIKYDYCLTKAQEGENLLALTPVGGDIPCYIENINLTFILPQGYIRNSANCFIYGGREIEVNSSQANGKTVLTAGISFLPPKTEVRIDLGFESGALTTYKDENFTPYWFIIAGAAVAMLILVLKFLCFNKDYITPIVNYEAPDKMDPLIMGKLIDNSVSGEDVTSLIFYWADKGYLAINLDDKDDPVLIRKIVNLPESAKEYEKIMFYRLFKNGEAVQISSLKNSFYRTVEKVKAKVNAEAKNLHDTKSFVISVLFAVSVCILLGAAPLVIAMTAISSTFRFYFAFAAAIPAIAVYLATMTLSHYRLKLGKGKLYGVAAGIAAVCVLCALIYTLFVPSYIISFLPKFLLALVCFACVAVSVTLISRTKDYTAKLNDIVGFRNFILLAEKDKLEMLLEEDPQFYYHILPYAQVLGVTDKWQQKFDDLTVEPPAWMTGSLLQNYFEFKLISGIIRGSMRTMSAGMISRPSSSSYSGGGHGGFGGFSGGGHGGGGIRFK